MPVRRLKFEDYPIGIRDLWAAHESLGRVGFAAKDLYAVIGIDALDREKRHALFCLLRTQGLEFVIPAGGHGPFRNVEATLHAEWPPFIERLNRDEFDERDLQKHFFQWIEQNGGASNLVLRLIDKGFRLPKGMN